MTHKRVRQALGGLAWLTAAVVIGLALLTAGFRVLAPLLPEYREDVSAWASDVFGAPVELDRMDLRWRALRPELVLAGVRFVSADAQRALSVAEVRIGVSLYSLFARGRLAPARIVLVEPDLTVIVAPGASADAGARWTQAFEARGRRGEVRVERGRLTLVLDNGRRRMSFDAIDGHLQSDGLNHRLELDARPGHGVEGRVTAQGTARGWPGDESWTARATLRMTDVDLGAVHRLGGLEASVEASLDLAAELVADRGAAQTLRVTAALADIDGAPASSAAATLDWTRRADGWDATFQGTGPGGRQNGALTLAFDAPADAAGAAVWRLDGAGLYLEDLALFAAALPTPADATLQPWLARAPRGELRELALLVRRPPVGDARGELSLVARALGLDADPASDVPGFHGVSLTLEATHARGRGTLAIADGGVYFPRVFRAPFSLASAEIAGDWTRSDRRWRIALPTVAVRNAHVAAGGTGALTLVPGDRPRLTLDLSFTDAELGAHAAYLPVNTLSESLVAWLDRAVQMGRAPHGTFRYDGPAGGGALAAGEAMLEARFPATGLTVAFADGWPALEDGSADVTFTARGFEALVSGGRLGATAMRSARVAIDDFSAPVLDIRGGADGELGPMLDTFRTTPVGGAQWLRGARADGHASLTLGIALPLADDVAADVAGTLTLADASFALDGFKHPLIGINGVLAISEDGVDADGVNGTLLGRPAAVAVATARDEAGAARAAVVRITATLDQSALERIAERPLPMVRGESAWQSTLTAPYDDDEPELRIASDLVGLAIDLPAPIGKLAEAPRALAVRIALARDVREVTVDDGDLLRARGVFERDGDSDWLLARGRVHLGSGAFASMPTAGLAVSGVLAHWRHGTRDAPVVAAPLDGLPLTAVDLAFGEFELYGRSLGPVRVVGHRAADAWTWTLDGPQVAGAVALPDAPDNARPIHAVFERLVLPPAGDEAEPERPFRRDLAATAVPPVTFHATRLRVGALDLGEVNGALTRVEHGIALERFTATRSDARIVAEGSWRTVDGYHRTALRGSVDSTDVQATLAALGYAASMEAAAGHMELDVSWMDSVLGDPLATLAGTVSVRLERGNLLEVEAGAGRVFGLLSLYALPRRLALDFSDVFRRGLAFDTITGAFEIREGQAFSDDLELRGPAVRVEVRGRTGLATRDYEQEAQVTANLASSLTLAGALAGGPGVGAALLIASELFKGPLENIARVRYRVTGSWEEPAIERIDETR